MSKHLTSLAATAIALVLSASVAQAALSIAGCLAQKQKAWGGFRKCEAGEKAKLLQLKPGDLAKCQTKFDEKLAQISAKAAAGGVPCRYGDNGDGTVTDYDTGLQWEQKTDDDSVHDKDDTYSWNTAFGGTTPNGTAFTEFLGTLNAGTSDGPATSGCFAGHCDWRLPVIEELATILDVTQGNCGGGTGPCIAQGVFGPTIASEYWSASTFVAFLSRALGVDFTDGSVLIAFKHDTDSYVRAVRSGL